MLASWDGVDEFEIYIRGFASSDSEPVEVGLHRVFDIDERRARELLHSLPRVVKRQIPAEHVARYERALAELGADFEVRRSAIRPAQIIAVHGAPDRDAGRAQHGSTLTLPPPNLEHNPWAGIEPSHAELPQGELPPRWEVPGLELDVRPGWLVAAPSAYEVDVLRDPVRLSADSSEQSSASAAEASEPRSGRVSISAQTRSVRAPATTYSVGTLQRGKVVQAEIPLLLRFAIRLSVGVSLFIILSTVRHCNSFDKDVDKVLARWGNQQNGAQVAAPSKDVRRPKSVGYGPMAAEWMESDLHQFTNGDKDRVRELVGRFESAGSDAVHVGQITRSGMVQIGGELVVELAADIEKRKAVLAEYHRFLQATFGELVASPQDPGGDVLRIAL